MAWSDDRFGGPAARGHAEGAGAPEGDVVPWRSGFIPRLARQTTREAPWPVAYLTGKYKDTIAKWPETWITGQISEINTRRSGSAYITLKDDDADVSLSVVAFGQAAYAVAGMNLAQGDKIVVRGRPEIWEKATRLSFHGFEFYRAGEGDLKVRIEELRRRLKGEGLFDEDRKQPLPRIPACIGLICAPQARAEGDIKKNVLLRWPIVRFKTVYVKVQGPDCPREVTQAIGELDRDRDVDVIIVARGGGSFEDLIGFSDESVVRATADCATPIVSAIGHEDDWTLIELAADYRASTPTGAAQAVVPDIREEWQGLMQERHTLDARMDRLCAVEEQRLEGYLHNPMLTRPANAVDPLFDQLALQRSQLDTAMRRYVDDEQGGIERLAAKNTALSPLAVLERGYAVVRGPQGHVITDPVQAPDGAELTILVRGGEMKATRIGGPAHTPPQATER